MGLSFIGCKCLFATHLHDLSQRVDELNRNSDGISRIDNLVAILADEKTGKRSYKIRRIKPDGLSYAKTIAVKYGITFENIIKEAGAG
jgi:DNA mismatch repair ATPase MutS